jgi:hypothetical protein
MKYFLYESMNSVAQLCKNCKNDIKDYLRKHPLDSALGGKRQLSRYLCEFHNHTNEKTGKEIHNCHNIVSGKAKCIDCEKAVIAAADSNPPITVKESLESFKDISAKVFKALCNKYKIPIPHIKFHHCPDSPETSCASMLVDNATNEIVEKPTIYLHPNVYGLRTIFHEFIHYAKQLKKDSLGTLDELTVEKETQDLLNEEFPFDKVEKNRPMAPTLVVKDTFTSRIHNFPRASRVYTKYLRNTKRHDFPVSNGESGDWIFDMVNDIKEKKYEVEQEEKAYERQKEEQHNALSFLDGIYTPFANLLGLKAHDLNRNNSPVLISNAAMTLVKSNMTPLGALLVSTLSSIGMFAALFAGKNGIGYGDRVLLNSFGSNLFWSGLDYMRPDNKQEVIEEAVALGQVVSQQKWNLIPSLLIDSPFFSFASSSNVDAPSSASPLSGRRGIQRAAGGASRGATGGIGGRSSLSKSSVDQSIAEERYIAGLRNQQRLTPGGATAPATPFTKDVPTGAAAGNPAGKGGGKIGPGGGVVGTDYMNNTVIIPDEFGEYDDAVVESQFGAKVASSNYYGGSYYNDAMRGPREDFIELEPAETKRNTIRDIYFQGQDIGDDELGVY